MELKDDVFIVRHKWRDYKPRKYRVTKLPYIWSVFTGARVDYFCEIRNRWVDCKNYNSIKLVLAAHMKLMLKRKNECKYQSFLENTYTVEE